MKNSYIYFLSVLTILTFYGFSGSNYFSKEDGKKIFVDQKCISCHSVKSFDLISKKKDATDFSSGNKTWTAEFLSQYLKKEIKLDGALHKNIFKGTDDQLKTLIDWLLALKTQSKK
ncbi:MAG: hypothetical protein HXY50_10820 [Ignavibacteriaceae bacterium]|nr:hypothetical protein [Ignavibacteriaceae bacterium]